MKMQSGGSGEFVFVGNDRCSFFHIECPLLSQDRGGNPHSLLKRMSANTDLNLGTQVLSVYIQKSSSLLKSNLLITSLFAE